MPNVYVEARPKGRPENSPIEDYVVEDHADLDGFYFLLSLGRFVLELLGIALAKIALSGGVGRADPVWRLRFVRDPKSSSATSGFLPWMDTRWRAPCAKPPRWRTACWSPSPVTVSYATRTVDSRRGLTTTWSSRLILR